MRVVYSPAHLGHDPETEAVMGEPIEANEQPERAERIREALLGADGFELHEPTQHGLDPITAVHDPYLNMPLPSGTGDGAYLAALDRALEAIAGFGGSIVVVSVGLDTYKDDPISDFALTTPVYGEVGRRVASLGRCLVIVQEGGYQRPSLGDNVREWLRGVLREPGYDRRT